MKKILFISKGIESSSTRYRASQYFKLLIKNGYVPLHSNASGGIINLLKTLNEARKSDVVILIRKTFPYPIFWLLRKLSKTLIFDFDDAIFCHPDGSYSATRMTRFKKVVTECNHIFAGNRYLAEIAGKFNPSVTVIPTSVDTKPYDLKIKIEENEHLKLVWIGSSSTRKYVEEVIPFLEIANKKLGKIQLKIVADFLIHSDKLDIKNIRWSEETEIEELNKADIGIAPMPENNWTKGKCALKILQYMAAGLPVITSKAGVNGYVVENNITGYVSDDYQEWIDLIKDAITNKKKLSLMGNKGKQKVREEYDIHVVFSTILKVLKKFNSAA
jgi:glycosyltransferase involved in cell wall biosynthesis